MIFRILFLNLFFINCFSCFVFSSEAQNIEALNVSRISKERIEAKKEFFKEIFEKSRQFRKAAYISSGISLFCLTSYLGYKFFLKKDQSKSQDPNVSSSSSNADQNEATLTYLKRLLGMSEYKDVWEKEDTWGITKFAIGKGFSRGIDLGIAGVVVSIFFALQKVLGSYLPDQFMQFWNGNEKERFLLIQRHLGTNIDLLHLFFDDKDILCDKSEINDNYSVFIDSVETLVAFVLVKLELAQADSQNYALAAIFNSQENLISKINDFSCEFQDVLNKLDNQLDSKLNKFFGIEQANALWGPFKQLNNQLIRFSNLCFSVFYENN